MSTVLLAVTGPCLSHLQRRIRRARRTRALIVSAAVISAATIAVWLAAGYLTAALMMAFAAVLMTVNAAMQTVLIRRLRRQEATLLHAARPRPDYAAIAAMETEIWGRAFDHAGAPTIGSNGGAW